MDLHTIKTEKDYQNALGIIDDLLEALSGSEELEYLELLSILVEDYENKYHKIDAPDPIAAIQQRAEHLGLTRKDLEKSIGSRSRVSEVLNKKRSLTLSMIRKLNKNLNIPADILIQEEKQKIA
jgi:HTH-type transcriptional regulator/antitoxin HigA|tara:strand:- start:163 stop:534 length:372 start_codon:yes stop_codon:yes gene_type:complete